MARIRQTNRVLFRLNLLPGSDQILCTVPERLSRFFPTASPTPRLLPRPMPPLRLSRAAPLGAHALLFHQEFAGPPFPPRPTPPPPSPPAPSSAATPQTTSMCTHTHSAHFVVLLRERLFVRVRSEDALLLRSRARIAIPGRFPPLAAEVRCPLIAPSGSRPSLPAEDPSVGPSRRQHLSPGASLSPHSDHAGIRISPVPPPSNHTSYSAPVPDKDTHRHLHTVPYTYAGLRRSPAPGRVPRHTAPSSPSRPIRACAGCVPPQNFESDRAPNLAK